MNWWCRECLISLFQLRRDRTRSSFIHKCRERLLVLAAALQERTHGQSNASCVFEGLLISECHV